MDVAYPDLPEKMEALLATAPERPNNTKKELVRTLLPEIQELKRRRYTYREIVVLLQKQGIDLSESTLKTYVQQHVRKAKSSQPRGHAPASPLRLLTPPVANKEEQ